MTGKIICEGCGRYEDECVCPDRIGRVDKQDELLQEIISVITSNYFSLHKTDNKGRMPNEEYIGYVSKVILAKILAKVKQHYEHQLYLADIERLRDISKTAEATHELYEQKRLDRPELRAETLLLVGSFVARIIKDRPIPEATMDEGIKLADQILALIPDMEARDREWIEKIEDNWQLVNDGKQAPYFKFDYGKWQSLKQKVTGEAKLLDPSGNEVSVDDCPDFVPPDEGLE